MAVSGVTTHPALYYTSPTQLAAVLPAATPVGTGTLTVIYGGALAIRQRLLVVASAVGIGQFNQIPIPSGTFNPSAAIGIATDNTTGALLTFTNSGVPGEIITLWATGLGADPADSDTTYTSSPHAVNTPLQIYVGGVQASILYQGSAGYPGVTQIDVTIPASVTTGCYVSLAAVTGTVISNVVVLPINPGGGTCVEQDQGSPITGAQILQGGLQDTINAGGLSLIQTNVTDASGTYGDQQRGRGLCQKTADSWAALRAGAVLFRRADAPWALSPGGRHAHHHGSGRRSVSLTGPVGLR